MTIVRNHRPARTVFLRQYCNAADENVFTRILKLEKNPDILLVNTCRVLHSFPQFWNAGEVIRGGHQNNVLPF